MIIIRKAILDDNKEFAELVLLSAPVFPIIFGNRIKTGLQNLFRYRANLFSFEHVYFAEVDGKKAGMILGYDWQVKKRESLKTGFLLFKEIGFSILGKLLRMIKLEAMSGGFANREYYINNIAVYPQYRGRGIGKRLIFEAEKEAKIVGAKKIILGVEKENITAINFYKKLGYRIEKEFLIPLKMGKLQVYYRMTKEVK